MRHISAPSVPVIAAAGCLSLAVAMGIGRFAFTPMLPLMIRGGELDMAGGGWLAAANYLGYLAGALSAAQWRWPARWLALLALAGIALVTAAMAVPAPAALWALWRFLAGLASAWAFVGTSVWCLAALAGAGAMAGSIVYAGVGAGIALTGAYCLVASAHDVGAAALWWQLGALALAGTFAVLWLVRGVPPSAPAVARPGPQAAPGGTRGLVLAYGAMGFGYILPATFLPELARKVVDDPRVFGLAWPVFGATAVASMLAAGWWLARTSRLQVWAVSQALMAVGVLLPSVALAGWTVGLSALLVGGTFMVITLAGVQELRAMAPAQATAGVARMTTAFALGQIAGPVLSALLVRWPALRGHGLDIALQAGAVALFASAAWLWRRAAASHHSNSSKELSHVR